LKAKDEIFNKFQEFNALVENLSESKIKVLRSNKQGLRTFAENEGLRGSRQLPTTPNRMGLQRERIDQL
jgi:hypothetical protein